MSKDATLNNSRTLEIIRDDLKSMLESEGTCWDCVHPHIFVVMGASVSSCHRFAFTQCDDSVSGRLGEEENLPDPVVVVSRWPASTSHDLPWLCPHESHNRGAS